MTVAKYSAVLLLAFVALIACDDMTGAGAAGVPSVAGTYTGPVVLRFSDLAIESTGSARLTVVQAGAEVTVSGSFTLAGVTVEMTAFTGRINATGFFTVTESGVSGTTSDATCGRLYPVSSSLTFADGQARLVENATTDYCGNIHLSGTLTR